VLDAVDGGVAPAEKEELAKDKLRLDGRVTEVVFDEGLSGLGAVYGYRFSLKTT
jgi:hypothetical protein